MPLKTSQLRFKRSLLTIMCIVVLFSVSSAFMLAQPLRADAAASKLTIQFTCAQATDHRSGSVCVHTQAKAALTIIVRYCTGAYATSGSLKGTQYADARGNHSWSWTPDTKCRGRVAAYVIEKLASKSISALKVFTVK